MKIQVKVSEVNHEDLVNLFSDAFYGNSSLDFDFNEEDYDKIPEDKRVCEFGEVCLEDKVADILLNGGKIKIYDLESEEGDKGYGRLPHKVEKYEYLRCVGYEVTLKDIVKGMRRECVRDEVVEFSKGEGDFYTAWNIVQAITFGEVVYG